MILKLLPMLMLVCIWLAQKSTGDTAKSSVITQSSVKFSIRNAGMEVKGTISGISADIAFDPKDLEHSHIRATADPATLQTGIGIRDKHLQRSDYFDVKNYHQIQLVSKAFHKAGKNKFIGHFYLTIKGITKEIAIPFTRTHRNSTVYNGSFEINRLDFNLGEKSIILDEKVKIFIVDLLYLSGRGVKRKINNLTLCHNKEGSSIRNSN